MKEKRKFGVIDQIGYVFGDMGGSFVNLYVDAFFLTFCTYVLGIKATWVGSLFLFARLWDAVNDPIIGSFPDRWQIGKSGDKFKPYIKIAMIPLAVSGLLCFTDVSSWGSLAKHGWVIFAYLAYGMSYTGTSMPFGSMAAVITNDPVERTKLSRARAIGGTIVGIGALSAYGMSYTGTSMPFGSMAAVITNDPVERTKLSRARAIGGTIVGIGALSLVPQFVFNKSGEVVPSGFFKVAVVFGALSLISYYLLLKLTTERVRQTKVEGQKFNYGKVLKGVLKNRPMLGVMLATVGSLLYITGNGQLSSYLYKEFYHAPQVLSLVSLVNVPIMLVFFPVIPKLSQKFGKRNVILTCSGYNLIISTVLFLVPIQNVYVFLVLNTLAVSGQTAFTMLIWAFVTDCIDYSEFQTGERSDGSLYSIYTFSRKIGSTLASTIASFSLGAIGYVSGIQSQAPEIANHIRSLCTSIPVITCVLELIGIGLVYNLTKEKTEEMYTELNKRRTQKNVV